MFCLPKSPTKNIELCLVLKIDMIYLKIYKVTLLFTSSTKLFDKWNFPNHSRLVMKQKMSL